LTPPKAAKPRVLVFSKTKGWVHTSIPFGVKAIQELGKENGFRVDTTKNASLFHDDNLKQYQAVIFLSTTDNVLNAEQQAAFERYIQAGGGFVGIHSASATEYDWPWYNKLVGAHFASHPIHPGTRKGTINVIDKNHPATSGLPDQWEREDEWYNFRSFYSEIKVLATLDENSYEGGTHGNYHPISWYHEYDGGRSFYTALGHDDQNYGEPLLLQHLLGGIKYAMGKGKKLDYKKAYSVAVPEENRFVKTTLVNDLSIPMELAVSDKGEIFYTELRSGNLYVYDTRSGKNALVHKFEVNTKGGTGLIGVTLDPNFDTNRFIYLFYTPPKESEPYNFNLTRFTVNENNTLDLSSEKVLLQVPVQEKSGSHYGGSLAWDKEGNLYISTGDSSSPFPSNGYAPLDERPGQEFYSLDAQRSSGNTNDFKGKILRIHPEPDGTYTIPKGNLFPPGTDKTRPEIYIMGCRNPYRIAVNPKTSVLYWGEIGPDAGKDSIQGPTGYDEFNQAKKAGNYGWPYFVGNNQAYSEWDFATNTAGPKFNPAAPINNSPNNTGLTQLPAAVPAMIWYPYLPSKEFPELGQGGRSAMVGAFYTYDKNSTSKFKFPEYFDGKLFVFDWMRNWVMAMQFDENENYKRSHPLMTGNGDFRRPIDLTFGKDGVMYMLEYGSVYGADNEDARLVKIEYNAGNRAPVAKAGILDVKGLEELENRVFLTGENRLAMKKEAIGEVPLTLTFSAKNSADPDDDEILKYQWLFDGQNVAAEEQITTYTFTKPGIYNTILKVIDQRGQVGIDTIKVIAGNSLPHVVINTPHNKSFYWDNKPFPYSVKIDDKEDNPAPSSKATITFEYTPEPGTLVVGQGYQLPANNAVPYGYTLINNSDCKACHTVDKVSIGPSYMAVSHRYKSQDDAVAKLSKKIITGGGGNWGKEHVMSAHPQLSSQDAEEMVRYILSLSEPANQKAKIQPEGVLTFTQHKADQPRGIYTISASYTDRGANSVTPLTSQEVVKLRNAKVRAIDADAHVGFNRFGNNLSPGKSKSYVLLKDIDFTRINKLTYEYASKHDGEIEARIDSYAGPVVARIPFKATGGWDKPISITTSLDKNVTGKHHVYFVFINREKVTDEIIKIIGISFD